MEPIIGIDLGTTNSVVAVIQEGSPRVLTPEIDNGILPSVVGLDTSGNLLVGKEARNQMVVAPDRTVASIKRSMGTSEPVSMGEKSFSPQEISAFILKALKQRAEDHLGVPIKKAVITVPAYFTDSQRQATKEAGEIAGLNVVRIINEPTAAALAYEHEDSGNRKILVYDLGGGTFDVSIVNIENGVVEVMASTGDNHLGGDDFDRKIALYLAEILKLEHGVDKAGEIPQTWSRLLRAAEEAKIALSFAPFARITLDHIARRDDTDIHLDLELSRDEFEEMIQDDIERTMEAVSRAMTDAGVSASDIHRILLVGGSTRIPMIANLIEDRLKQPPHSEIDPDLCVALGAGIQAAREMGVDTHAVLIDITPYTFGTAALGEMDGRMYPYCFIPMIKRNTRLPASRSDVFYTVYPDQEMAKIDVFQGENPDAMENVLIGHYHFTLTPSAPQGSAIILKYDLDVNGILKLKAEEKSTGRSIEAVIENAFTGYEEDDIAASRSRVQDLWGEKEEIGNNGFAAETPEEMQEEMAAILEEAAAKLPNAPEEDRDEIVDRMEDLRSAVAENRMDEARQIMEELEDILYYIDE